MRWNWNPQHLNTSPTDGYPDPNQADNHTHVRGEAAFPGAEGTVTRLFLLLFYFFFDSGSASGMMLLKVSILCFKPFKSMSSMENQLPPRGTELFACSVSSLRVLWFMEQQLNGLLGGFGEIQVGLRAGTFKPKSKRARTWGDEDLFRHREWFLAQEVTFCSGSIF